MFLLSLCWLLLGTLIGAIANAATRRPSSSFSQGRDSSRPYWILLAIGGLSALLAGWLGTFLFGNYIATALAIWVAVLAVITPSLITWARLHTPKLS